MKMKFNLALAVLVGTGLGVAATEGLRAQAPTQPAVQGATSANLVMRAVTDIPNKDFVVATSESAAGRIAPPHTHPGDAYHYVVEGQWDIQVDGKAPVTLKAGQGIFATRDQAHGGTFPVATKLVTFYILDKGVPRVIPASPK